MNIERNSPTTVISIDFKVQRSENPRPTISWAWHIILNTAPMWCCIGVFTNSLTMLTVIICWGEEISSGWEFPGTLGIEVESRDLFLHLVLKNLENTRSGYVKSFLLQVQHWPHNHLKDKSCHGNWISNCEQPLCEAIRQNQSWLVFHNHLTLISKYPSLLSAYPRIGLSAQLTYFHLNKWNSTR